MNAETVAQISFILYLAFFGWLGYRRGLLRESIVAITAILAYIVLRERSATVVGFANLASAGLDFAVSGGFSGSEEEAIQALMKAEKLVTPATQDRFLYIVWVGIVVATFLITTWWVPDGDKKNKGWAILVGMLNAFFFAIIVIPGLAALFGLPHRDISASEGRWDFLALLGRGLELVWNGIMAFWGLFEPLGAAGIFIVIMSILVFAAFAATSSRSGSGKAKSSSNGSSNGSSGS